jgi:type 1 fimbriae regulatory protein FimB/type 1 fimbriae regulatory protein FimE
MTIYGKVEGSDMRNPAATKRASVQQPTLENGKVASPPRRKRNAEVRTREHLTPTEVEALLSAARGTGRYGERDEALILIAYRHGLRVSELVALRWDQFDLKAGLVHVRRSKKGTPSTHPLQGDELRSLRKVLRGQKDAGRESPFVFTSERGGPMTDSNVRKLVARLGEVAELPFPVHPHMLRHGCGYALANAGHDTRALEHWLGHRNITHTVRYTELSPDRFKDFWRK